MQDYTQKTDNELLADIRNNDSFAMDALIKRYKNTVEAIAMKYIDSPLEKDDLVQEGMIGLLAAVKSYRSDKGAKFATYANKCINNSMQTALNKLSRLKSIPQAYVVELNEDYLQNDTALSAEDKYLAKVSVSTLTEVLYEGLSSFENQVLRLYIVGYSYEEIAEKLGKNVKAIDNAIQRIRKKLRGVTF